MSIKEKGYMHWEGEFLDSRLPWLPITRMGVMLTFKRKFFKPLFFLSLVPSLVFLVGIYISERLEDFPFITQESDALSFLTVDPQYFYNYYTFATLMFMIVMILVFAGAGLIADDLRYNALQLYFSRPITKLDYLLGKASVIVFFLFLVTLIPGIVFILMKMLFAGSPAFLGKHPLLLASVIGYSLLVMAFFSFFTLLLSAITKNRRYVAVLIFGLYLFSDVLYNIFNAIFHNQIFALLSIRANFRQMAAVLFGQNLPYDVPWFLSLFVILGICGLSALVLARQVRSVEVLK
jgi:ABC-2 type transport system permease protein